MSLYEFEIHTLDGAPTTLRAFEGKAVLAVNVASKCGLTPQYEGLEKLHEDFSARGFSVVGFPCNQFHGQEPGTAEEIKEFCSLTYGVTFPLMEKIDVNGHDRHPIFAELTKMADPEGYTGDVRWNFEKWIISPDGRVVGRFSPLTQPHEEHLIAAIEQQLPN